MSEVVCRIYGCQSKGPKCNNSVVCAFNFDDSIVDVDENGACHDAERMFGEMVTSTSNDVGGWCNVND